ncbi:MAG: hypothetical protein AAGF10_07905 [Verrucomicrobiota bacterium]
MNQPDFTEALFREPPDNPDVGALERFLDGRGWLTYKQLKGHFPDWSDRYVRGLAEASEGRILSGQKGYKLTRQASPEEYQTCRSGWLSQSNRMRDRIRKTDLIFHGNCTK